VFAQSARAILGQAAAICQDGLEIPEMLGLAEKVMEGLYEFDGSHDLLELSDVERQSLIK
jgi:hypothetical protein